MGAAKGLGIVDAGVADDSDAKSPAQDIDFVVLHDKSHSFAPGEHASLAVTVVNQGSQQPEPNAIVCAAVVDESILTLADYDWQDPLKQFYGNRKILLADALSYRFMPEGKNRGVFLQNTIGLKIGDVTLRGD